MSKFSRFLKRLFHKTARYGQDMAALSLLLQGALLQIENAKARADMILANPSLPEDQKLVEIQQLFANTLLSLEDTVHKAREILHNAPGV